MAGHLQSVGRILLVVQPVEPPTDDEWTFALAKMRERRACVLVLTDGGSPTEPQRERMRDALRGRTVPMAIVSASPIPRLVTSVVALFNKAVASFGPESIDRAYAFLGLDAAERERVAQALLAVQRTIMPAKHATLEGVLRSFACSA